MTLGMCVKLTKNWLETKKREHLLQQEKLETELKFLKSQFNPHFLFNTINSIFVLIHKNPDKASSSLAKFSELLRYQLYECNEQQIPLSQEISYLQNFIELERLRQEKNLTIDISIIRASDSNLTIAPFMLIPFVENAFKHVSKGGDENGRIVINLELADEKLTLIVKNTVSCRPMHNKELMNFGGLGLKNIERRLELIYPLNHTLTITSGKQEYEVILEIALIHQRNANLKLVSV
jgi:LytS/YehU family sensor histidine kinase